MSPKNAYRDFVNKYFARGALGISVGLAAVTPASPTTLVETITGEQKESFSDRLSVIRSAVSEEVNGVSDSMQKPLPPPRPPPEPFKNFFGKAPFQDTFKNTPPPAPKEKPAPSPEKSPEKKPGSIK